MVNTGTVVVIAHRRALKYLLFMLNEFQHYAYWIVDFIIISYDIQSHVVWIVISE